MSAAMTSVSHISLMGRPFGAPRIHMDENAASAPIEVLTPPADTGAELSISEATAAYTAAKAPKKPAAESAEQATAEPELAQANAGPEEVPGEEPEGNDAEAEELPPIERPRSWSKDDDDDWNALPRERQEKIAKNEQARESEISRRINEATDKLKGLTAKEQLAEQARQQYETQAKAAYQVLLREQTRDFPDVKTLDDVRNLAASDPFRYLQWQAHQTELAGAKAANDEAEKRVANEKQTQRNDRNARETALLIEKAPEFADAKKLDAAQKAAAKLFSDIGYSAAELTELGNEPLLGDHRIQLIINDALKYRAMQTAKAAVVAKSVPPVQRPGTSKPAGSGGAERIQALDTKLNNSGDVKDAVALYLAQQRRAS